MTPRSSVPLFLLVLVASCWAPLLAEQLDVAAVVSRLEPEIERAMEEGRIPSCTVALVSREATLWTGAYGFSNLWAKTRARKETVYLIGSTFKAISTAALLQLVEAGRVDLDRPVSSYLGDLSIAGEDPNRPVTLRHVLTHTSGLPPAFGPHEVWGDSVPDPLEVYLRETLQVTGPPGERLAYSNLGYTLVAYVIQQVSGLPFRRYVRQRVLDPLGMSDTRFVPTPELAERLAVPYVIDVRRGVQVPAALLKADVWPAGIVYGTIGDQARWLRAVLRRGELDGRRILAEKSVDATWRRQWDRFAGPMHSGWGNEEAGYGLTWWTATKNGHRHFAHSGSVPGFTAFLEGNADLGLGFAILTNGNRAHPHLIRLADLALRLMAAEQGDRRAAP